MGRYQAELFRACRLVVDTGLHARGWTRERAIGTWFDDCASSPGGATQEVVRYMAWPGQALGYKLGELTILAAREDAQKLAEGHCPSAC